MIHKPALVVVVEGKRSETGHVDHNEINMRKLWKACKYAVQEGFVRAIVMSHQQDLLFFPRQVEHCLTAVGPDFPMVEIITNGQEIANGRITKLQLAQWCNIGLTRIMCLNGFCGFNPPAGSTSETIDVGGIMIQDVSSDADNLVSLNCPTFYAGCGKFFHNEERLF